jgi:hypothetical protein
MGQMLRFFARSGNSLYRHFNAGRVNGYAPLITLDPHTNRVTNVPLFH